LGVVTGRLSRQQEVLARLASLRQNQYRGRRAPHKPLLVLLALGRLTNRESSELSWSEAESQLSSLIAEFGPVSKTGRAQSAAYPFTRLRSDGVWTLSRDVPMDLVGPLSTDDVVGRLEVSLETALHRDPQLLRSAARALVDSHFPPTVAPDVLAAVGLDPDDILRAGDAVDMLTQAIDGVEEPTIRARSASNPPGAPNKTSTTVKITKSGDRGGTEVCDALTYGPMTSVRRHRANSRGWSTPRIATGSDCRSYTASSGAPGAPLSRSHSMTRIASPPLRWPANCSRTPN
jgi:hypothetical protein